MPLSMQRYAVGLGWAMERNVGWKNEEGGMEGAQGSLACRWRLVAHFVYVVVDGVLDFALVFNMCGVSSRNFD